ncbi:MAG: amidase [Hyphomicrobiales bacterium]|nr:amidase [Hyphomicrobiales bacterium]
MTDILDMSAGALTRNIAARRLSAVELMRATLERIDALNPRHNAIVALRPREELMAEARAADAAERRGPLHGLPMAVKDLEDVAGLPTRKGSPLTSPTAAAADSVMAGRLRQAGAILIGKTNVPEFGLGSYSRNPVYGITRNAYDVRHSAGGSSSGAAVALALRMVALADGSDYGGSLRNPAGWNNVYGFRPSYGRIPRVDADVWTPSLAVLGPMARSVEDLALLLSVQAGFSPAAPLSLAGEASAFQPAPVPRIKGARIAWVGDFGGAIPFEPGVLERAQAALTVFESLGAVVEEATPDFPIQDLWRAFLVLRHWHNAALLPLYENPDMRAHLPPAAIYEIEAGLKLSAYDVAAASQTRTLWHAALMRFHATYDFWALPTAQCFAFPAEERGAMRVGGRTMTTYHEWMQCVVPATMAGAPVAALPAGFDASGRAMGIQLVGRVQDETGLLAAARAYDEATRWLQSRPPEVLGSL